MKILWLKSNLLHPLDSGGKIRTYNVLRGIREKHEIDYATFAEDMKDREYILKSEEYCHNLFHVSPPSLPEKNSLNYYFEVLKTSLLNRYPFTIYSYRSREFKELISKLAVENNYDLLIADFLTMCLNIPEGLKIPRVHFSHNVEAKIWKRLAKTETNLVKKMVFAREGRRIEKFEGGVIRSYPLTIAVSIDDRDHFLNIYGGNNIDYITTGVDTDYFNPNGNNENPNSILFLGSMDWMPNIDAVLYFAEKIFPLIRQEIDNAELIIVGKNPVDSIKRLGETNQNIIVTGTVSDTRPYIRSASCTVVPIRIGGGTRIKIYELMSMAKAVVATTIGAEGLSYKDGENIIIEDDPENFSQAVVKLLRDEHYRFSIGEKAREHVIANCSWNKVTDKFINLLSELNEG